VIGGVSPIHQVDKQVSVLCPQYAGMDELYCFIPTLLFTHRPHSGNISLVVVIFNLKRNALVLHCISRYLELEVLGEDISKHSRTRAKTKTLLRTADELAHTN
jgi:hypothetical protein